MELILKYFPQIRKEQYTAFERLAPLYQYWNSRINVISRRDIDNLYLHHILYSLSIAKVVSFKPGTRICDAGTGGGFPGIPLAVLFPEVSFHLVDSIGKKIKVVQSVIDEIGLLNVTAEQNRIEELKTGFDFIISRAVTSLPTLVRWVHKKILPVSLNEYPNGIFYLKGAESEREPERLAYRGEVIPVSRFFSEDYFDTKVIVYIDLSLT
jgi:16S rRNA (guanine527-N7)-methyltransferase